MIHGYKKNRYKGLAKSGGKAWSAVSWYKIGNCHDEIKNPFSELVMQKSIVRNFAIIIVRCRLVV